MHINCVICGDNFVPSTEVFVTPCGHMFHYACLIQWIERSSSCPQCRAKCTEKNIHRVYFNIANSEEVEEDPSLLLNRINSLNFTLKLKESEIKSVNEENAALKKQTKGLRFLLSCLLIVITLNFIIISVSGKSAQRQGFMNGRDKIKSLEKEAQGTSSTLTALRQQISYLQQQSRDAEEAKEESRTLRKNLEFYKNIETVIEGSVEQVEDILNNHSHSTESLKSLATFTSILKREIKVITEKKKQLNEQLKLYKQELHSVRLEKDRLNEELILARRTNGQLEQDILHLQDENKSLEKKLSKLEKAISSPSSTNARDTALRRLAHESPAPEAVKKLCLSNPETTANTSAIIKALSSPEDDLPNSSNVRSPFPLNLKSCTNRLNTKYSQVSEMSTTVSESKFSIFQKTRFGKPLHLASSFNAEESYDGMGGHSKHDVFPTGGLKIRTDKIRPKVSAAKKKTKVVHPHKDFFSVHKK